MGLNGTELAISESQERMAIVIDKNDLDYFINRSIDENLEATLIARVTEEKRLVMTWKNSTVVDLSPDFLDTNGAEQQDYSYDQRHTFRPEALPPCSRHRQYSKKSL